MKRIAEFDHIEFANVSTPLGLYAGGEEVPFGNMPAEVGDFKTQLKEKSKNYSFDRDVLHTVLKDQYKELKLSDSQLYNLELLKSKNTFTITTGHQLNIFGGPVYMLYKIIHVIKTTRILNTQFSEYNFVPVFWMASEDHDFEEIASIDLFGKKFTWEKASGGPVGKLDTDGLKELLAEIEVLFERAPNYKEIKALFEEALEQPTLTEATRYWINSIFADYGLIIVDGDHKELKRAMHDFVLDEVENQSAEKLINARSEVLKEAQIKKQVNPREINFFGMSNDSRERVLLSSVGVEILGKQYTQEELLVVLSENPELLSPNVIFRPLFQEAILPNLAYIGGFGEVNYWLQLDVLFEHFNLTYPFVIPRNSTTIIHEKDLNSLKALSLTFPDLSEQEDLLVKTYLEKKKEQGDAYDPSFSINQVDGILEEIIQNANEISPSLAASLGKDKANLGKQLDKWSKKIDKEQKQKEEVQINKAKKLKKKYFESGPQERTMPTIAFLFNHGKDGIFDLLENYPVAPSKHLLVV